MKTDRARKQIVLIDRQHSWLERSAETLRLAGFDVATVGQYDYPPAVQGSSAPSKLVILGCASIGQDEFDLIKRIIEHKDHLLVLSTALSPHIMRTVFLVGADDVTNKPYHPDHLITAVHQVLRSIPLDD